MKWRPQTKSSGSFLLSFNLWPTFSETEHDTASLVDCLHKFDMRERNVKASEQVVACGYITNLNKKQRINTLNTGNPAVMSWRDWELAPALTGADANGEELNIWVYHKYTWGHIGKSLCYYGQICTLRPFLISFSSIYIFQAKLCWKSFRVGEKSHWTLNSTCKVLIRCSFVSLLLNHCILQTLLLKTGIHKKNCFIKAT